MPLFRYRFTPTSLDRIAAQHVWWRAVLYVLNDAHPAVREFLGAGLLRVIAADENGHLLLVNLIEAADESDAFDIISARYLGPDESAAASMLLTPEEDR